MEKKSIKTILHIIAFVAIVFSVSSCKEKFFDQEAGDRFSPDKHYRSLIDLEISMLGVVANLQEIAPNLVLVDGLRSDLMDVTSGADLDMKAIYNQELSVNNKYLNGSSLYQVIINVNEVLLNIDKITKVDKTFTEYYKHSYEGYLVGMRSWAYFTLIKMYGKAVIIPDNMTEIPAGEQQPIDKTAMLDTLINHLTPYLHTDKTLAELRLNYYFNTKALIGEIYLEKNDYANAITYLTAGINSYRNTNASFKVGNAFWKENWRSIFYGAENISDENIAVVPFSQTEQQFNPLTAWTSPSAQYQVKPSTKMIEMFQSQVQNNGDTGDVYRGYGVTYDSINGAPFINKYMFEETEPFGADIILSRAGDLHLLLAEAFNRVGNDSIALTLLNSGFNAGKQKATGEYYAWSKNYGIRGRLLLEPKEVPVEITDPTEIMLYIEDLIIAERACELAYEGKRWFDLVRIASRRDNPSYLADKVAAKYPESKAGVIKDILMNPANWYLPSK